MIVLCLQKNFEFKVFAMEIIRKIVDMFGTVRKHSQELQSFGVDFEKSSRGPSINVKRK